MGTTDYIYRVLTQSGLNEIEDAHFRARRWPYKDPDYPHSLLKELSSSLPITEGLFRICFYTHYKKAETSAKYDFNNHGEKFVARCSKSSVLSLGFAESEDDGFGEGVAYLFWKREVLSENNKVWSTAGIPFHQLEVFKEGKWHRLDNIFNEIK